MTTVGQSFWNSLAAHRRAAAIVDGRTLVTTTYGELSSIVDSYAQLLSRPARELAALFCENDADGIAAYLACLRAGHAVFLTNARSTSPTVAGQLANYRPEFVIAKASSVLQVCGADYWLAGVMGSYQLLRRKSIADSPPHADLSLLLSTSASTGSPKLVRHSGVAIDANARQIVDALRICPEERAMAHLPLHYVYGLSVLNSHLAVGASLVLQNRPSADPEFWRGLSASGTTMLPAVSHTIESLRQLGITRAAVPSLRRIQHSGDRLPAEGIEWISRHHVRQGTEMYMMYGQTEACGRMTVLPADRFDCAPSVGLPVKGARLEIATDGEVIYHGPNVMLGYAESRADLGKGGELDGRLATGDLGRVNVDGMLQLSGRKNRICKIEGHRINLDELEARFQGLGNIALTECSNQIVIATDDGAVDSLRVALLPRAIGMRLPPQAFRFVALPCIPRNASGKVDYLALRSLVADK